MNHHNHDKGYPAAILMADQLWGCCTPFATSSKHHNIWHGSYIQRFCNISSYEVGNLCTKCNIIITLPSRNQYFCKVTNCVDEKSWSLLQITSSTLDAKEHAEFCDPPKKRNSNLIILRKVLQLTVLPFEGKFVNKTFFYHCNYIILHYNCGNREQIIRQKSQIFEGKECYIVRFCSLQ